MDNLLALDLYQRIKENLPNATRGTFLTGYVQHGLYEITVRNAWRWSKGEAQITGGLVIYADPIRYQHGYYDEFIVRLRKGWTDKSLRNACDKITKYYLTESRIRILREHVYDMTTWLQDNYNAIEAVKALACQTTYQDMTEDDCNFWLQWVAENRSKYDPAV